MKPPAPPARPAPRSAARARRAAAAQRRRRSASLKAREPAVTTRPLLFSYLLARTNPPVLYKATSTRRCADRRGAACSRRSWRREGPNAPTPAPARAPRVPPAGWRGRRAAARCPPDVRRVVARALARARRDLTAASARRRRRAEARRARVGFSRARAARARFRPRVADEAEALLFSRALSRAPLRRGVARRERDADGGRARRVALAAARLWQLDEMNRLVPGVDYEIDLQAETHVWGTDDRAPRRGALFKRVRAAVLERELWRQFAPLLARFRAPSARASSAAAPSARRSSRSSTSSTAGRACATATRGSARGAAPGARGVREARRRGESARAKNVPFLRRVPLSLSDRPRASRRALVRVGALGGRAPRARASSRARRDQGRQGARARRGGARAALRRARTERAPRSFPPRSRARPRARRARAQAVGMHARAAAVARGGGGAARLPRLGAAVREGARRGVRITDDDAKRQLLGVQAPGASIGGARRRRRRLDFETDARKPTDADGVETRCTPDPRPRPASASAGISPRAPFVPTRARSKTRVVAARRRHLRRASPRGVHHELVASRGASPPQRLARQARPRASSDAYSSRPRRAPVRAARSPPPRAPPRRPAAGVVAFARARLNVADVSASFCPHACARGSAPRSARSRAAERPSAPRRRQPRPRLAARIARKRRARGAADERIGTSGVDGGGGDRRLRRRVARTDGLPDAAARDGGSVRNDRALRGARPWRRRRRRRTTRRRGRATSTTTILEVQAREPADGGPRESGARGAGLRIPPGRELGRAAAALALRRAAPEEYIHASRAHLGHAAPAAARPERGRLARARARAPPPPRRRTRAAAQRASGQAGGNPPASAEAALISASPRRRSKSARSLLPEAGSPRGIIVFSRVFCTERGPCLFTSSVSGARSARATRSRKRAGKLCFRTSESTAAQSVAVTHRG